MNTQTEYKSLYEYLGHAAGSDLGKQVAAAAAAKKVNTVTKQVSNPVYKGKIVMYPKSFLYEYFNN